VFKTGSLTLRKLFAGVLGVVLPMTTLFAQDKKETVPVPVGGKIDVNVNVKAATAEPPAVTITRGPRTAKVVPCRKGCVVHTGGGNIDVQQPSTDTLVITMKGVAVATAGPVQDTSATLDFDLSQCFEVITAKPETKVKMTLEGRVIGLLRSDKHGGSAGINQAVAAVSCDTAGLLSISLPSHSVCCGQNLSVNDQEGPCATSVLAGKYTLHQNFSIGAAHPRCLVPCKPGAAEFAPIRLSIRSGLITRSRSTVPPRAISASRSL